MDIRHCWLSSPDTITDERIKDMAQTDLRVAFAALFRKYFKVVRRRAGGILKDFEEANDVAQEVFIRARREERLFDQGFFMRAWLLRVAHNLSLNARRNRHRREKRYQQFAEDLRPVRHPNLNKVVLDAQLVRRMDTLLQDLQDWERQILILRYWQDKSQAQIAQMLGIERGTVKSRLNRARLAFRGVLEERGYNPDEFGYMAA